MSGSEFTLEKELPLHGDAIEQLHRDAFGPGRFARTAFRVREAVDPVADLSYVALSRGHLAGSVRLSPIRIGGCRALLLGPLAVHPDFKQKGAGHLLMEKAISKARDLDYCGILLVGDLSYYGRLGFAPCQMGRIQMPGPVDPARLLLLAFDEDKASQCVGKVVAG